MVCAVFLSVTLLFTALLREDEPLKMFQLRKDIIIFSHIKALNFEEILMLHVLNSWYMLHSV